MTNEIQEAKNLRWLAFQFQFTERPEDDTDKLCNAIHVYAEDGAKKIDAQAQIIKMMEDQDVRKTVYTDVFGLIEDILDVLIEVGNGTTDEMLHVAADKLFMVRGLLKGEVKPDGNDQKGKLQQD